MYKLCFAIFMAVLIAPTQAGIVTFFGNGNQGNWEAAIGGVGAITGVEDFNSFVTDLSGNGTTLDLPLLTITSPSTGSGNFIDVPPHQNSQANQDGTPSFSGLEGITIDFKDDLSAFAFDYLDSGSLTSQNYTLQVNFVGGGSDSFLLNNPGSADFRGVTTDNGTLIDSITWLNPSSPSPFSVDDIRVVSGQGGGGAVPEPSSLALACLALFCFAIKRK